MGLGHGRDDKLVELDLCLLGLLFLLGTVRHLFEQAQLLRELFGHSLHVVSTLASHSDDSADALGDTTLLEHNQFLDLTSLVYVSATTKLDADVFPFGVVDVFEKLLDRYANTDDTDRIGISLAKHGTNALDISCSGKRDIK